ncbi:ribose 5-phosphate isomerase B [Candidatus Pacearchaeota archaeon CG10_big_fil_rev_8_21_14_0_10_34_76]|nr:MAG: ribose 5-phosphate isomerase B [Candidatus Pacearchaeota archaeon CG10_big_fil_rev_8_21_14_0_10_34_76]
MKIYLGADHAGFDTKEKIRKFLEKREISYEDFSNINKKEEDDYPDYAFKVAEKVVKNKGSRGILICGTGTGMVIAANKVRGVRAACAYDNYSAKMAKKDNDVNVLCLRGRKFSSSKAVRIIDLWLKEEFSGKPRHKRRIDKISKYEKKR